MGRVKRNQTQSARLYFEEHDHREIIYNDEYINGVYLPDMIEPQFRKYKKLTLLMGYDIGGDYGNQTYSLDVYNQFLSKGMLDNPTVSGAGKGIVFGDYVSVNGYDFKIVDANSSVQISNYLFCQKYPIENSYSQVNKTNTITWYGCDYNSGEEEATFSTLGSVTLTDTDWRGILTPCGSSPTGIFAYRTFTERTDDEDVFEYNHYYEFYHITANGFDLLMSGSVLASADSTYNWLKPIRAVYHDGKYCAWCNFRNSSASIVRIWSSSDLSTWSSSDLVNELPTSTASPACYVLYRGGVWYFYVVRYWSGTTYQRWYLFTSSDLSSYTEITLPDYIDIPFLDYDDGIHGAIQKPSKDYLRLILNNYDGTIPTSNNVYEVKGALHGITTSPSLRDFAVEDGSINLDIQNVYCNGWLDAWYVSEDYSTFPILYYLDNMTFSDNGNNFAINPIYSEYDWEVVNHEPIASDDYIFSA